MEGRRWKREKLPRRYSSGPRKADDTAGDARGAVEGCVDGYEGGRRRGGSGGTSLAVASSASDEWRALARLLFAIRCDCQPGDSGDGRRGWFVEERDHARGWVGSVGGGSRTRKRERERERARESTVVRDREDERKRTR